MPVSEAHGFSDWLFLFPKLLVNPPCIGDPIYDEASVRNRDYKAKAMKHKERARMKTHSLFDPLVILWSAMRQGSAPS
jgi:hypothetical protein